MQLFVCTKTRITFNEETVASAPVVVLAPAAEQTDTQNVFVSSEIDMGSVRDTVANGLHWPP